MPDQSSASRLTDTATLNNAQNKNVSILLKLIQFIRPYQSRVFSALIALIFTAAVMLSVGQGVRMLIDEGFAQQSIQQLQHAVLFILVITVLIAGGTFTLG